MAINIKRIYDPSSPNDGFRVLVDRLWPRGISRERANLDLWLKDAAPSPDLRRWFGHDPDKFKEFSFSYQAELEKNPVVNELEQLIETNKTVTLLYGAKDSKVNHAVVLKSYLVRKSVSR
jgi:uncharacterized protein YeaO (DUF488 family)